MISIKKIILALLSFMLISCDPVSSGLFFRLEKVVQIEDEGRGIKSDTSISTRVGISSFTSLGSHYYLTTTRLLVRVASANNAGTTGYAWQTVQSPSGFSLASNVASMGSNIIALFFKDDGSASKIYQSPEISYANSSNPNWTELSPSPALTATQKISNFFVVGGQLILEIQETRQNTDSANNNGAHSYRLYNFSANRYLNDAAGASPHSFTDGEFSNSMYWFITDDSLYSISDISTGTLSKVNTSMSPFTESSGSLQPSDTVNLRIFDFSGLDTDSSNRLYLTTKKGYIFMYSSGMWSSLKNSGTNAQRYADSGSNWTRFTGILVVPASFSGSEMVFASSENEGYSIITPNASTKVTYLNLTTDGSQTNFFSTALSNGHISELYYATVEKALFALTPSNSLWRGTYVNGSLLWKKE